MAMTETLERDDLETMDADEIARQAEEVAIDRVAESQGPITAIKDTQKDVIRELFAEARGGDDASFFRQPPVVDESLAKAAEQAQTREARFSTGARVAKLPGNVVGEEHDDTRTVLIDTSMAKAGTPEAQAVEVDMHENRHKKQKLSNDEGAAVPETGNAEIDELLGTGHIAFREEDAMFAAGKEFTAQSYTTDYEQPVNRVESFLNGHGKNGSELVRNAGLNGEMKEVRTALLSVFVEEEIRNYMNN